MTYEDKLWIWKLVKAAIWIIVCHTNSALMADIAYKHDELYRLRPTAPELVEQ